ncbi:hypothetical protein Q8A73_021861 [Channa argus]|nr:hypothetical protein Q8A73_021861 [Channa argus]
MTAAFPPNGRGQINLPVLMSANGTGPLLPPPLLSQPTVSDFKSETPAHGAILPPKPLLVDDLQGRLLLLLEYRGVDYVAVPGLCSKHMPVLGFGERERKEIDEEEEEKPEEESSYLSLWVLQPFISDCLSDFLASPGSFRPSAASLVYCPIITLSMATIRLLIARCRLPQWMNGGVMGRRIRPVVKSKSLEALSYLGVCADEERRDIEHRQTGGKADESVFLNGMNVSCMLRRVRKGSKGWQEAGKRVNPRSALGWRGA